MIGKSYYRLGIAAWLGSALVLAPAAGQTQSAPQPAAKKAAKPQTAAPAAATGAVADTKAPSEAGLRARVEQLEEQLVDLQVTIGTLESLAKSAGTSASSATYRAGTNTSGPAVASPSDNARVEQLDIQLRALLQQVEQQNDRIRQLESAPRTAAASPRPVAPSVPPAPAVAGFGTTTVTPALPPALGAARAPDSIGDILQTDSKAAAPKVAAVDAATGGNPKVLYEQAYGFLLAQDYAAAETAFGDFLQKFPNDALAGNAQYWLGETHFFRGQFKAAAAAYYKGYQSYGRSVKAPDSLLKLAMSLDKLGQKDAACQSFAELNLKFPNAGPQIKSRAQTETQRIGCP